MRTPRPIPSLLCLLSGLLVAIAAPGCGDSGTSSGTLDGSTDGSIDGTTDGTIGPNACTSTGGFCMTGGSCPTGYLRDDGALSCPAGPGLGIANQPCCVPEVQPPRATDYKQTCAVDADCELIDDSKNPCCPGCMTAAIAKSDGVKYEADLAKFRSTCKSAAPCPGGACMAYVAVCKGGTCQAAACAPTCPGTDAGSDAPDGG